MRKSKLNMENTITRDMFYEVWENLKSIATKVKDPNGMLPEVWYLEGPNYEIELNSYSEGYSHDVRVLIPDVDKEIPVLIVVEDYHKGCRVEWQDKIGDYNAVIEILTMLKSATA